MLWTHYDHRQQMNQYRNHPHTEQCRARWARKVGDITYQPCKIDELTVDFADIIVNNGAQYAKPVFAIVSKLRRGGTEKRLNQLARFSRDFSQHRWPDSNQR